jgi:hypothetical protein
VDVYVHVMKKSSRLEEYGSHSKKCFMDFQNQPNF